MSSVVKIPSFLFEPVAPVWLLNVLASLLGCSTAIVRMQVLQELQAKHQRELEQQQQAAKQEEARLQAGLAASQQQIEQLTATVQQLQQEVAASR